MQRNLLRWLGVTAVGVLGIATACRPAAERTDGQLRIVASNLPAQTNLVRAQVATSATRETFEVPPAGRSAVILVESVPTGPIEVTVDALLDGVRLGQRQINLSIAPDEQAEAMLSFQPSSGNQDGGLDATDGAFETRADAGFLPDAGLPDIGTPWTEENISWLVLGVNQDDVRGSDLRAEFPNTSSDFSSFLADAAVHLGRDPERFEVKRITLTLQPSSSGVAILSDLFNLIEVFIDATTADLKIKIGSGSGIATSETDVLIFPHETQISLMTDDIGAGTFTLEVRGESPRTSNDAFSANLELQLTLVAY